MTSPDPGPDPDVTATWDAEAATFDEAPDHGLRAPATRAAWRDLLLGVLPPAPARVVDLGSGTGTLAVLLADEGYAVAGLDVSPEMLRLARAKAAGRPGVSFVRGDAAEPPLEPASYDAVLCRHVLWALPDPLAALRRWESLVGDGPLVLVEGHWSNDAGLRAEETVELVEQLGRSATLTRLTDAVYWGRDITDDRYLVVGAAG